MTPWDVQSKRIFTEDVYTPTLQTDENPNIMPVVLTQYGEEIAGTLRARYDSSPTPDNGQNAVVQPLVMASGHSHAEIGVGGIVPTLTAHNSKDAPVLAAGPTFSPAFARPTGQISSSTTRASEAGDSCSTRDWSGLDVICMADDNARAAVDENLSGSLKVGGGQPFVAFRLTETK